MLLNRRIHGGALRTCTRRRDSTITAFAATNVQAPAKEAAPANVKPLFTGAVFRARLDVSRLGLHSSLARTKDTGSAAPLYRAQSSIDLDAYISTSSAIPIPAALVSARTMASRDKVIRTICSVSRTEGGALLEVLADGGAIADVAGVLMLLVQTEQHDQVTELGEAFLAAHAKALKVKEPQLSKDLALIVAWSHAAQAEAHLTSQGQGEQRRTPAAAEIALHPGAGAAHAHAAAALALAKKYSVPVPGDVFTKWERLEKALAPLCALSLLTQYPHASTALADGPVGSTTTNGNSGSGAQEAKSVAAAAAAQRAHGVQMLKAAMWSCDSAERLELVGLARTTLTAAELISLYEGSPAPPHLFKHTEGHAPPATTNALSSTHNRAGTQSPAPPPPPIAGSVTHTAHAPPHLEEQELYDLAMAHIAEGVSRRWPQSVWRAEQLLGLVAEQGVGVDVSLELSVCALLLGRPPATPYSHPLDLERLDSLSDDLGVSSFGSRSAGAGLGGHGAHLLSLGSDAQVLLSEVMEGEGHEAEVAMTRWAESWINLSVMGTFPEKAGQEVSLDAWFKNPTVALLNQMGKVGALAGLSAEAAGGAASSLLTGLSGLVGKAPGRAPPPAAATVQPAGASAPAASATSSAPAAATPMAPSSMDVAMEPRFTRMTSPSPSPPPPDLPSRASAGMGEARGVASAQQLAQVLASSSLSVDDLSGSATAAAHLSLWRADESGHIRPRMRARIVDGPLPMGLPAARPPSGPWWHALGISSNALTVGVVAMLCFVNRHRIMDVATRSGYLPAVPQTAMVIPHTTNDLLRGVEDAQRAAGSEYLTEVGAQRLLQQWLVMRGAALGGVSRAHGVLPVLLAGRELKAVKGEVSRMEGEGHVLRLTHGVVNVVGVEAGKAGRSATVTARVCEQGSVLSAAEAAAVAAGRASPLHLGRHHSSTHAVRVTLRLERTSRTQAAPVWKVCEVTRVEMAFPEPLLDDL